MLLQIEILWQCRLQGAHLRLEGVGGVLDGNHRALRHDGKHESPFEEVSILDPGVDHCELWVMEFRFSLLQLKAQTAK